MDLSPLIAVDHLTRNVATSFRGSFSCPCHRGLIDDSLSVRLVPDDVNGS